ncbi:unnamed protein product [Lota lota]
MDAPHFTRTCRPSCPRQRDTRSRCDADRCSLPDNDNHSSTGASVRRFGRASFSTATIRLVWPWCCATPLSLAWSLGCPADSTLLGVHLQHRPPLCPGNYFSGEPETTSHLRHLRHAFTGAEDQVTTSRAAASGIVKWAASGALGRVNVNAGSHAAAASCSSG